MFSFCTVPVVCRIFFSASAESTLWDNYIIVGSMVLPHFITVATFWRLKTVKTSFHLIHERLLQNVPNPTEIVFKFTQFFAVLRLCDQRPSTKKFIIRGTTSKKKSKVVVFSASRNLLHRSLLLGCVAAVNQVTGGWHSVLSCFPVASHIAAEIPKSCGEANEKERKIESGGKKKKEMRWLRKRRARARGAERGDSTLILIYQDVMYALVTGSETSLSPRRKSSAPSSLSVCLSVLALSLLLIRFAQLLSPPCSLLAPSTWATYSPILVTQTLRRPNKIVEFETSHETSSNVSELSYSHLVSALTCPRVKLTKRRNRIINATRRVVGKIKSGKLKLSHGFLIIFANTRSLFLSCRPFKGSYRVWMKVYKWS